jgi:predicted transcriptional regulator
MNEEEKQRKRNAFLVAYEIYKIVEGGSYNRTVEVMPQIVEKYRINHIQFKPLIDDLINNGILQKAKAQRCVRFTTRGYNLIHDILQNPDISPEFYFPDISDLVRSLLT